MHYGRSVKSKLVGNKYSFFNQPKSNYTFRIDTELLNYHYELLPEDRVTDIN